MIDENRGKTGAPEKEGRARMRERTKPGSLRVIVAEDDEEMLNLLVTRLKLDGCTVTACRQGVELAWRLSGVEGEGQSSFDVVVSDIRMPGFTALEILESFDTRNWPPVILITAFGSEDTHETARALGAVAVIDKPFNLEDFVASVKKWGRVGRGIDRMEDSKGPEGTTNAQVDAHRQGE